jgi:hypothetical protein
VRVLQVMAGAEHGGAEAFFCRLVPALSLAFGPPHGDVLGRSTARPNRTLFPASPNR